MNLREVFNKDCWLILLILLVSIMTIATSLFNLPSYLTSVLTILALILVAIKDLIGEKRADEEKISAQIEKEAENARKEMTEERIAHIDEEVAIRNAELKKERDLLEYKQKIMADFLRKGIITEESILKNLNQESFMIVYHYNLALSKKYVNLLPNRKLVVKNILDNLGFVAVGRRSGTYFFHVISTNLLPKELRQSAYLEEYLKKKILQSWRIVEKQTEGIEKERLQKKLSSVYFLGKIFTSELKIGYLNYPLFSDEFIPYLASFTKKVKTIDKQKLHELMSLASLHYFVEAIPSLDKEKILAKEEDIKKTLGVKSLYEYQTIPKEQWVSALSGVVDATKSQEYAESICNSINRHLPIIKEIAQVA